MTSIREWWYTHKLRSQKERALFECEMDLNYIKKFKSDMFKYDESKARRRMSELKKKGDDITPQEQLEIEAIADTLAQSKAVKYEFEKTQSVIKDLKDYLSCL